MIGVGLNLSIAPDEFPPSSATQRSRSSAPTSGVVGGSAGASPLLLRRALPDPLTAAAVLNRHLERWVEADPTTVLAAWRERDALRGREVAWDGGSGVADGVDDRGYLVVVTPGGDRVAVGAGEVHLTRS